MAEPYPEAITRDELAAALARRHPDKPRDSAESLARALFADVRCCRPEPLVMPADEFAALKAVAEAAGEPPWTPEEIAGRIAGIFAAAMANPGPLTVLNLAPSEHWRERAEAAEAKLAAIAEHCRLRMQRPGRSGMTMAAAGLILGIAEGSSEEPRDG